MRKLHGIVLLIMLHHVTLFALDPALQNIIDRIDSVNKQAEDMILSSSQQLYSSLNKAYSDSNNLSAQDQTSITTNLKDVESVIEKAIADERAFIATRNDQTKKIIKTVTAGVDQKSITVSAGQQTLLIELTALQAAIKDSATTLMKTVEPKLLALQESIKQKMQSKKEQEANTQVEKERQVQEKNHALFQGLAKVLPLLNEANKEAREVIVTYFSSGILDQQAMGTITQKYQKVMNQLYAVYNQSQVVVDFDDRSSLVTSAMKKLVDLYGNDIALSIKKGEALSKKDKRAYYQIFYELAQRLQGSGANKSSPLANGYLGAVTTFANNFFTKNKENVVFFYQNKKKEMTLNPYIKVLQDLVTSSSYPTAQDLFLRR